MKNNSKAVAIFATYHEEFYNESVVPEFPDLSLIDWAASMIDEVDDDLMPPVLLVNECAPSVNDDPSQTK